MASKSIKKNICLVLFSFLDAKVWSKILIETFSFDLSEVTQLKVEDAIFAFKRDLNPTHNTSYYKKQMKMRVPSISTINQFSIKKNP